MELTVIGPNLSSGSTFHVHKAGCGDIKRKATYRKADKWTADFASLQEICEDVYTDIMNENEGSLAEWTAYTGEFDIFPCCGEVPDVAPVATEETPESSLPVEPEGETVTPSKAPAKRTKKAKEAPVSKSTAKTRRTWNINKARSVVNRRDKKGMSWAQIGTEFEVSPRTARAMYDAVKGAGAHYDSRLEGKGGRFRMETVTEAAERQAANAE